MNSRSMTDDESAELAALTAAVDAAIATRRAWLDAKMVACATMKVGDAIYDLERGHKVGLISKLYRYWADRNPLLDTSPGCDYEFEVQPNCFSNTSCQPYRLGSRDEALLRAQSRAASLLPGNEAWRDGFVSSYGEWA